MKCQVRRNRYGQVALTMVTYFFRRFRDIFISLLNLQSDFWGKPTNGDLIMRVYVKVFMY